jgi:hypothetical protein
MTSFRSRTHRAATSRPSGTLVLTVAASDGGHERRTAPNCPAVRQCPRCRRARAADELQPVLAAAAEASRRPPRSGSGPGWTPWRSATRSALGRRPPSGPGRCSPPATTWAPAGQGAAQSSTARALALASMRPGWGSSPLHQVDQRRYRPGAARLSSRSAGFRTSAFAPLRLCWTRRHRPGPGLRARAERHRLGASQVPSATGPAGAGPPDPAQPGSRRTTLKGGICMWRERGGRRWATRSAPKG